MLQLYDNIGNFIQNNIWEKIVGNVLIIFFKLKFAKILLYVVDNINNRQRK